MVKLVALAILLLFSITEISLASAKKPMVTAARREDILFIRCQVSEYQIIEIAENVCNLKKEETDWILHIDIVEKEDKLEAILILHVPIQLRNFKIRDPPLLAKKSDKGINLLASLCNIYQTSEDEVKSTMEKVNNIIVNILKKEPCPASECKSENLEFIIAASSAKGSKVKDAAIAKALSYADIPNSQIRKVTSSRLLLSKQTLPHYYLTVDTRVDKLMEYPPFSGHPLLRLSGELTAIYATQQKLEMDGEGGKKKPET
ncbi:uncharacterized protein A4U43_C01F25380 [Asparagus officinalis]|uniref:2-oxoacid dehydrogenase acyltransferase catalytic domain-containing protein n=1 Tax=Asparagus officinalis TaxID=4686 RepID=A0A5P1FUK3_ASPOF|nr:uncharacterized protein A4U43_C01F25380 [Asparagus officinalis]